MGNPHLDQSLVLELYVGTLLLFELGMALELRMDIVGILRPVVLQLRMGLSLSRILRLGVSLPRILRMGLSLPWLGLSSRMA